MADTSPLIAGGKVFFVTLQANPTWGCVPGDALEACPVYGTRAT